ncbi:hypothetical protein BGZ79_010501 [Entomortierella chlamydospora]|nr:hypothetical protein BGZ79_010501 [Entomortierella chlamydospora]
MSPNLRTCNGLLLQSKTTQDNSWQSLEISDLHPDVSFIDDDTPAGKIHSSTDIGSPRRRKRNIDQECGSPKSGLEPMLWSEYTVLPKKLRTQDLERCQYQFHDELFDNAIIKIGHRESRSLLDLPFELIIMILWRVSNPLDLWSFSQVCTAIRNLIDEKLWQNLYTIQSPIWSSHVQINHLAGGVKMWSRMVISDYLRRTLRWVDVSGNLSQAVEGKKLLRANLGTCQHYRPSHMQSAISVSSAESQQWRNVGPPALFTDQSTNTTLAAYMQARSCVGRTDHQIAVYGQSDHNTPITIIPSGFWAHKDADKQLEPELATENLGPAQLKDMKHFPAEGGRMRVVFVVAFGERNQMPADADDRDMYIVDVWSLLRIFEVYIPSTTPIGSPVGSIPTRGRVETIAPRSRQEVIRIRIVKIYSAINQSSGQIEDRIALIGIHQGSRLRTVLMTSPLLATSQPITGHIKGHGSSVRPSSWECHVLGGMQALEPSCMALFPAQSDFECLLVILDQHGNGEIWDWMRRVRVSVLKLRVSDDPLPHRDNLYYWGVHVNWAIEEPVYNEPALPFNLGSNRRSHGDFRVVALSDGASNEWESCWWNISEKELRKHLNQPVPIVPGQPRVLLTSEPVSDSGVRTNEPSSPKNVPSTAPQRNTHSSSESVPLPEIWAIESSSRHFEYCTRGVFYPQQNSSAEIPSFQQSETDGVSGTPLMFIAYLIWDHYRIALTAEYGICIFDMDQEDSCDILDDNVKRAPQWVTTIEGAEEDPLIDIATVGNCLFLTRKYSHMVWVF